MQLLVGADPEVFVQQAGKYLSAYGMIPGNKENPYAVDNGAVQVDGMALEFNILPADSSETFLFNITSVMQQLREMVPGFDVVADPVATFTEEYLKEQPPEALELGCDPDYNGWTLQENKKPDFRLPMRTGAGHVHIGFSEGLPVNEEHLKLCGRMAKQLDFYLGLPSVLLDPDVRRRSMYGQAGAFRPKHYGVEYRVLSNFWLKQNELIEWVFNNSTSGLLRMRDGEELVEQYGDIQAVINSSDKAEASRIIEQAGIPMP